MAAWIEIGLSVGGLGDRTVAAVWRRGLKYRYLPIIGMWAGRRRVAAWIEMISELQMIVENLSPPCGGVD